MARKHVPFLWKCFIVAIIIFIIDYLGLCVHFFELDYAHHFRLPSHCGSTENSSPSAEEAAANNNNNNNYYDFGYLQKAINKCSTPDARSPHLTVVVKSALNHKKRREVIRRTWGFERRFSDVHYRCLFLLGASDDETIMEAVREESSTNKDIVQGDFIDAYFNNTLKTMLGIRWAKEYCSGSDFYMFVDDDYYVSIKNVLKFIAYPDWYPNSISGLWSQRQHNKLELENLELFNEERLFAGYAMQTAPLRHKFSKWYVPLSEYPFDLWPPYITAGAYILSNNALEDMYAAGKRTCAFRFDDIFLGMVALKANITLTHCDMFHFERRKYGGPESYSQVLASHGYEDSEYMEKIWTECRAAGYA